MPACGQCGENNPPEARLCWSCGTQLPAVARPGGEERRVVTVLFVDLVDFTGISTRLDPEDLRRVQAPYFRRVRTELERFGGHVEKYIGDAVMALFGAPVAHGDDAHRAVLAAFAIRRAIGELNDEEELDLKVRIAVNTGEAFVDLGARTDAGEGMAAGLVVTSFRLQQAAPVGEIVVGEATYRATQRGIEYVELEPVTAKGKPQPLRAWKAVAVDEPAGRPAAKLVGRDDELAYLQSLSARTSSPLRGWSRSWAGPESGSRACSGSSAGRWKRAPRRSSGVRGDASVTAAGSASLRSPSW